MAGLRSRAAVLYKAGQPSGVCEVDVQPPTVGEVFVEIVAAGVCHIDYGLKTSQLAAALQAILGNEGAGIAREVGEGVTTVYPTPTTRRFSSGLVHRSNRKCG